MAQRAVAEMHFLSAGAEREAEQLMAEADAEHRYAELAITRCRCCRSPAFYAGLTHLFAGRLGARARRRYRSRDCWFRRGVAVRERPAR